MYILAGEIGSYKGDIAAALRGYEERMWPVINDMQKVPLLIPTVMAPQTALDYGCETTSSLSSPGRRFWNSLKSSSPVLSPARIYTGFRIMTEWPRWPREQEFLGLSAQRLAPVCYIRGRGAIVVLVGLAWRAIDQVWPALIIPVFALDA